ncbi:ribonucleotide reductase N-terminal alpha domain-containing protein [Sporosarcina beigongshangi]|uniref:ribonucleotide reductase N-terminal alpha domain-containing protein n=1 Tax=Sporosarcina beigongshangi TaxID=2782538 RepID=UPI00193A90D0|nr:ribonucleotide reductase N-terminal alpha domain-containing protein [Sporosarcina beigongshangi]
MSSQTKQQDLLTELSMDFGTKAVASLLEESTLWIKKFPNGSHADWSKSMISHALSQLSEHEPHWTFIATRIHLHDLYTRQRDSNIYTDFATHITRLVALGSYDPILVERYSQEELRFIGNLIAPERDKLFSYSALQMMMSNYITKDTDNEPVELPQERWLIIAMILMQNETEQRLEKIAEAYWAMSHLYMTAELPSLLNAGKLQKQGDNKQTTFTSYLDVHHIDIFKFLDGTTGDRVIYIPDLFMEQVESRGNWYLFDPYEVRAVMGYSLEDFYDEQKGGGSFREKYMACVKHPKLSKKTIFAIDLMKQIMHNQLTTGFPHMYYKDEVQRKKVNKHVDKSEVRIVATQPTQLTHSSINLGRAVPAGVLERLITIQVRMLDNAIDLNIHSTPEDIHFRGLQLGTTGWHHLLALSKIRWESTEAVAFADKLYENIAYLTIAASMTLAKEKGAYPLFKESDWHNGAYFEKRGYHSKTWQSLRTDVALNGVRNGSMTAVASHSSTAPLAATTIGVEPITQKYYVEEQLDGAIPVIAPDLNPETRWFYKSAYFIDQQWTLKQNAARQRHIDQCISLNLYVPNTIQATELLALHISAWKSGLKMTGSIQSHMNSPYFLNNAISI